MHALQNTFSDGSFGGVAYLSALSSLAYQWQFPCEVVERLKPYAYARRYVAAKIDAFGCDDIVGDGGAYVNDQQVMSWFLYIGFGYCSQTVGTQCLGRFVGDAEGQPQCGRHA